MQELVVEVGLRLAKVVVASVLGAIVYWVLTNGLGAPGSVQLALEAWIAGALILLVVETGIF